MQQSMIPGDSQECQEQELNEHRKNGVWEISWKGGGTVILNKSVTQ